MDKVLPEIPVSYLTTDLYYTDYSSGLKNLLSKSFVTNLSDGNNKMCWAMNVEMDKYIDSLMDITETNKLKLHTLCNLGSKYPIEKGENGKLQWLLPYEKDAYSWANLIAMVNKNKVWLKQLECHTGFLIDQLKELFDNIQSEIGNYLGTSTAFLRDSNKGIVPGNVDYKKSLVYTKYCDQKGLSEIVRYFLLHLEKFINFKHPVSQDLEDLWDKYDIPNPKEWEKSIAQRYVPSVDACTENNVTLQETKHVIDDVCGDSKHSNCYDAQFIEDNGADHAECMMFLMGESDVSPCA